jgi:hypothetical protein
MPFMGLTIDTGVAVLTDFDEDKFPLVQHDAYGEAGSDPVELQHPFGFYSRPRDPEVDEAGQPKQGEACSLLILSDGDDRHSVLWGDPRYTPKIPNVGKGGSAQYGVNAAGELSFLSFSGDSGDALMEVAAGASIKIGGETAVPFVTLPGFQAYMAALLVEINTAIASKLPAMPPHPPVKALPTASHATQIAKAT